jgi:hypothetical protein
VTATNSNICCHTYNIRRTLFLLLCIT